MDLIFKAKNVLSSKESSSMELGQACSEMRKEYRQVK